MPFTKLPQVSSVKFFSPLKLHRIWILLQPLSCCFAYFNFAGLPSTLLQTELLESSFSFLKSQCFKLTADMQKKHLWSFSPWFCLNQYFKISPTPDKEKELATWLARAQGVHWPIFYEGQCALKGHHSGMKLPSSQPGPLISPLLSVCMARVLTGVQSPLPPSLPLPPTPWLSTQVLNSSGAEWESNVRLGYFPAHL